MGRECWTGSIVSTLTKNKRLERSPDLLRLANAKVGAVTSNLLVSLLQHWGVGFFMTGLQADMELSESVSSPWEAPLA